MKLCDTNKGGEYRILEIAASEQISGRLEALGMNEGTTIKILNKKRYGAIIVSVRGTRMAMGYDIANQIEVEA